MPKLLNPSMGAGFPCGGWCPEGRKADDGPIPDRYPVEELAGAGYRKRTVQNIIDSDATAIFRWGEPVGGTALTLAQCVRLGRCCLTVDAQDVSPVRAAEILKEFIDAHDVAVLNVAGPSESRTPGAHAYTKRAFEHLLTQR